MSKKMLRGLVLLLVLMMSLTMFMTACGQQDEEPAEATEAEESTDEAAEEPEEEVESDIPTVTGTVTTNIDMTGYEAGKTVKVWVPLALSNDDQSVDKISMEDESAAGQLTTDALGNQMAYFEWGPDADPASRVASVSFHASRTESKIAPEDMVEDGEVPADMAPYLEGSEMVVVDGVIKELGDQICADQTTILGKARAIYDWVYDNMVRDNDVVGCGQGDVCVLIDTKAGKCTDINSVFVALCRSQGIPAVEMFGIRMNADDITGNQHCWAQFYLPGTGWIYADPADVLKAILTNEWDKADQEALDTKEYYWGGVDEKRVELTRGRDLILSPAQDGAALNDFGYPYAEVDGEAVDFYKPAEFVYSISFTADN